MGGPLSVPDEEALDDAGSGTTSTSYVNCRAADPLSDVAGQAGFALTVGMTSTSLFLAHMKTDILHWDYKTDDDIISEGAADLWQNLQEWSNYALIPEQPAPIVQDGTATLLAVTLGSATKLTCGELVAMLSKRTKLSIVQLKKTSAADVRGTAAPATRGDAQETGAKTAADNGDINPFKKVEDLLTKLGVGIGVAIAVALVIVAAIYFHERK